MMMTYGQLPTIEQLELGGFPSEGYKIEMHQDSDDWQAVIAAINQGIDSHLEAIDFSEFTGSCGRRGIRIKDVKSLQVLLRRLIEAEEGMPLYDETPPSLDLASCICETMGIEWI